MLGNSITQARFTLDFIDSSADPILTSDINQLASNTDSIEILAEQIQYYFITKNPLHKDDSIYGELLRSVLFTTHYFSIAEVLWNRYNVDHLEDYETIV